MATIHPTDLRERLTAESAVTDETAPTLVDVRTPAEYETGHIPGSVNVPLDVVHASPAQLREALGGKDVVLVCRSGNRAEQARKALAGAGLDRAWVLTGGVTTWESVGGDLNRGRETWELERQVRFAAGSIVLTAVLASAAVPALKWVAAFVGGGLVLAALTDTCAMGVLIAKAPWNRPRHQDPATTISRLAADGRS
ncbi:rhodanese-like domain-containing protein [Thalassiella azotivora]